MGLSLIFILIFSKIWILFGKSLEWQGLLLLVLFSQDFLIAGIFIFLENRISKRAALFLYALLCFWTGLSLSVYLVLGSPITKSILFASGGALSDSFVHFINLKTLLPFISLIFLSLVLPIGLKKVKIPKYLGITFLLFYLIGNLFNSKVYTFGLHRNGVFVFVESFLSKSHQTQKKMQNIRMSLQEKQGESLEFLKGSTKNFNVLVVVLESTAAQYLKPYGNVDDPMPTFSSLAKKSLFFENMYTVYPESIKGLFAAICSHVPQINQEAEKLKEHKKKCLPEYFKKQGYKTAMFHSGRYDYLGMRSVVEDRGFDTLKDANDLSDGKYISFGLSDERQAVKKIDEWFKELKKEEKFFLMYLPIAGHHPYLTPEKGPFPENSEKEVYFNALFHADLALKNLLNVLKKNHLDEKTIVIIYGDHGEAFFQHEGNYAHTLQIYEENVHIPFLIYKPHQKALRIKKTASLLDFSPTLIDLMGFEASLDFEGNSLLEKGAYFAPFFTDYSQKLVGLREDTYKVIYDLDTKQTLLYDLSKDKDEKRNLSNAEDQKVKEYQSKLESFIY